MNNKIYYICLFIFFATVFLFIYKFCFELKTNENIVKVDSISSFKSLLREISKDFYDEFIKVKKCNKQRKCLLKCFKFAKPLIRKWWKYYDDKDIPNPFPHEYPYLNNTKNVCDNKTFLFISVITPCNQLVERMAMRKIWYKRDSTIKIYFFIGYTSSQCQKQYEIERNMFNDISQMPIQENFSNETLFTIYLHKILPIICPSAMYYGKMDADQYINSTLLMSILKNNTKNYPIFYGCNIYKNFTFSFDERYKFNCQKQLEKYYRKVIPKRGITSFCGSFACWSSFLSRIIYKESLKETHLLRTDDQYIAWLIYRLNKRNMNISYYDLKCKNSFSLCNSNDVVGIHRIMGKNLYSFYSYMEGINNEVKLL